MKFNLRKSLELKHLAPGQVNLITMANGSNFALQTVHWSIESVIDWVFRGQLLGIHPVTPSS